MQQPKLKAWLPFEKGRFRELFGLFNETLSFAALFLQKKSSTVETAELNDCLPYEKSSNALFIGGRTFFNKIHSSFIERLLACFCDCLPVFYRC
jgi:hypothetical protein